MKLLHTELKTPIEPGNTKLQLAAMVATENHLEALASELKSMGLHPEMATTLRSKRPRSEATPDQVD